MYIIIIIIMPVTHVWYFCLVLLGFLSCNCSANAPFSVCLSPTHPYPSLSPSFSLSLLSLSFSSSLSLCQWSFHVGVHGTVARFASGLTLTILTGFFFSIHILCLYPSVLYSRKTKFKDMHAVIASASHHSLVATDKLRLLEGVSFFFSFLLSIIHAPLTVTRLATWRSPVLVGTLAPFRMAAVCTEHRQDLCRSGARTRFCLGPQSRDNSIPDN